MASTLVRNLASQIAVAAYANFFPASEKWPEPKGLPTGCSKMLQMIKQVTGSHFQPVNPAFILNEDCTSQYYCSGKISDDSVIRLLLAHLRAHKITLLTHFPTGVNLISRISCSVIIIYLATPLFNDMTFPSPLV